MADNENGLIDKAFTAAATLAVLVGGARAAKGEPPKMAPRQDVLASGFTEADRAPSPLVLKLDTFQKSHKPVAFMWAVLKKFSEDRASYQAALVAYFGFFSIFPLLIALISILGFALDGDPELRSRIADSAFDQIPIVGNTLASTIDEVKGSGVFLIVGILGALWAGLKIVDAAQNAMNEVWDLPMIQRANFIKKRVRGVAVLVMIFVGLVGGTAVGALASLLPDIAGLGKVAILGGTIALNMALYTLLFRVLTARQLPWRAHRLGGILAGLAWWLMQNVGVVYLSRVEQDAGPTYGSFASTIVLLTFIFISAQLIIFSAEVSVVNYRTLYPRALPKCPITDADRRAWQAQADSTRKVPAQEVISLV